MGSLWLDKLITELPIIYYLECGPELIDEGSNLCRAIAQSAWFESLGFSRRETAPSNVLGSKSKIPCMPKPFSLLRLRRSLQPHLFGVTIKNKLALMQSQLHRPRGHFLTTVSLRLPMCFSLMAISSTIAHVE
jgi:hypothetical protein